MTDIRGETRPRAIGARIAAAAVAITLGAASTAAAAPTRSDVFDSFDRTGTSSLGPNWVGGALPDAPGTPVLGSKRIQFPTATRSSAYWAPQQFGGNQEATLTKKSGGVIGVIACLQSPGPGATGYALYTENSGGLTLRKYVGGVATTLFSNDTTSGVVNTGDTIGIVVTPTAVEAWIKKGGAPWAPARSTLDGAAGSCSGSIGVIGQGPSGDDFRGGASVPPPAAARTAESADTFVDRIGVNTHFAWTDQTYCAIPNTLITRLTELGVRHIREAGEKWEKFAADPTCNALETLMDLYDDHGIRTQLVADTLNGTQKTVSGALDALDKPGGLNDMLDAAQFLKLNGALEAIEGPNEYDADERTVNINVFDRANWNSYVFPWRDRLAAYMPEFHSRSRARSLLQDVPVVAAGLAYGPPKTYDPTNSYKAYARLGDTTSTFEIGNMHPYSGADAPEGGVGAWFDDARAISRTRPLQATEIGYYDRPGNVLTVSSAQRRSISSARSWRWPSAAPSAPSCTSSRTACRAVRPSTAGAWSRTRARRSRRSTPCGASWPR